MAITASVTPLFTSLQNIKFSDLRNSFKEVTGGTISASELRRNTDVTNTNPIVPDATENTSVSTLKDLKISQFKNTIKYYDLNQSGIGTNLNLVALSTAEAGANWNSNLAKTVVKRVSIAGVVTSTSASSASLSVNANAYNLNLIISGEIYGEGGSGGAGASPNGSKGGDAMSLISTGGNIYVQTLLSAKVYGGGGGGAEGLQGASSDVGKCYTYTDTNTGASCGGCPGCGAGTEAQGCFSSGSCGCGKGCSTPGEANTCRTYTYYDSAKTPGGAGGAGGKGRGYSNRTQISLIGSIGTNGTSTTCPGANVSVTKTSSTGDTGASGGEWGEKGVDAGPGATDPKGGALGAAISGSKYVITLNSSLAAFKGSK
jgi:hypothetical protein